MEYKIGDIFYCDEEYSNRVDFCNEKGLMIKEIESDSEGNRQFQICELPSRTVAELANEELTNLQNWFNSTYTYREQKYRRLMTLNKTDDDGVDGRTRLLELYNEAEIKRKRIQELETLISETSV